MVRIALAVALLAGTAACASNAASSTSSTGDAGHEPDAGHAGAGGSDGSAPTDAGSPDAGLAEAGPADAGAVTPITLAEQWVAGWYGTSFRGENRYSHVDAVGAPNGYYTQWRGDPGVSLFANVSDCSSFSDVLMTRAYGWQPPTARLRPLAEDYYWAVRGSNRFQPITSVNDLAVGDTLALLYGTTDSSGDSGHVAWVAEVPAPYSDQPAEAGLSQVAVTIIDSSAGFHYAPSGNAAHQDDRYLGPPKGEAACSTDAQCISQFGASAVCDSTSLPTSVCAFTGVGRGQLRLYADATGAIAGYTWGTSSGSVFYARPSPLPQQGVAFTGRDVVAGRYVGP